jgi:aminoacylase
MASVATTSNTNTTLFTDPTECVDFFKKLLSFRTVSAEGPTSGAYHECVQWLKGQCETIGLSTKICEPVQNKPILIATLVGTEPDLSCVVLNSHYDVVPAMEEHWDTEPFQPVEKDGKIYARGTQDMKCVCAQYILALGRLISSGHQFKRTIHLTFVPDEETGGLHGMGEFLKHDDFKALGKVGVALDEGLANTEKGKYTVFYGERAPMWVLVNAKGPTGHGSRFVKGTAVEKLMKVANSALAYRAKEESKLGYPGTIVGDGPTGCKHCEAMKLGDVTTVNLTMIQGGVSGDGGKTWALNVIPTDFQAGFDIRVPVTMPIPKFKAMMDEWCSQDEGVSWEFAEWSGSERIVDHHYSSKCICPRVCGIIMALIGFFLFLTNTGFLLSFLAFLCNIFVLGTSRENSIWWRTFDDTCTALGMNITPAIFPAGKLFFFFFFSILPIK